ncbi:hypothetical protein SAMN04487975_11272 [Planococcus glaciei]|uniref:hypothetical protein n=1 Tax=Planococcus glaciei TaxID=459472 RepID=UPI0008891EBA|nr:hypothetical protein [Planococcus glaciei]SDI14449.1 hypothetical protein SAMN04487975_11272 [Planococcus glaciei]
MSPLLENSQTAMNYATNSNQQQAIKKRIIETSLYSVDLLPPCNPGHTACQVLLTVHPPAQAATERILPVRINALSTKTEILKKVSKAVQDHFAEGE